MGARRVGARRAAREPLKSGDVAGRAAGVQPATAHQHIDVHPRPRNLLKRLLVERGFVKEVALAAAVGRRMRNINGVGLRRNRTERCGHHDQRLRLRGAQVADIAQHRVLVLRPIGPGEHVAGDVAVIVQASCQEVNDRVVR